MHSAKTTFNGQCTLNLIQSYRKTFSRSHSNCFNAVAETKVQCWFVPFHFQLISVYLISILKPKVFEENHENKKISRILRCCYVDSINQIVTTNLIQRVKYQPSLSWDATQIIVFSIIYKISFPLHPVCKDAVV